MNSVPNADKGGVGTKNPEILRTSYTYFENEGLGVVKIC